MAASVLCRPWEHDWSRREWLQGLAGLAGVVGVSGLPLRTSHAEDSPPAAAPIATRDKQVLFVWIDGGMSQFESWDPKPNTRFGGPFRPIQTSLPGVQVSELMPATARQMQHLAVVRNMCTQDNSHSAGVPRIQRGDPKNRGVTYPFFGSAIAFLLGPTSSGLPPYVSIKPGNGGFIHQDAGFLGPKYGALAFGDGKPPENLVRPDFITAEADDVRQKLRELADRRYAERHRREISDARSAVFDMARTLMSRQDLFDTSKIPPRDIERYGTHEFGRHMLQARRMLEAGVRFVKVTSYGWDTHGDNFHGHQSLMPRFDQAFAAIMEDLAERGMLDNVLVIAMSEFGRTPRVNGHVGRDHWPESWSLAMGGTGIRVGQVVGQTNTDGSFVEGDAFDIGHMFHTWFQALGVRTDEREYDNNSQPLPLAHEGCKAVYALLV